MLGIPHTFLDVLHKVLLRLWNLGELEFEGLFHHRSRNLQEDFETIKSSVSGPFRYIKFDMDPNLPRAPVK